MRFHRATITRLGQSNRMSQTVDGHKISDKGTSLPVIFLGILASIQVADRKSVV